MDRVRGTPPDGDVVAERRRLLARLFDAHHDAVHRFLLARSGSRTVAEDVASDTFADAARLCAAGHGDEITRPWLITVARRRLIDRWRADDRSRRRVQQLVHHRSGTAMASGADGDGDDRREHVLEALRSLPERQRLALSLRYLDEHSVAEVAEALGTTYRAAESVLARARSSFATAYRELS